MTTEDADLAHTPRDTGNPLKTTGPGAAKVDKRNAGDDPGADLNTSENPGTEKSPSNPE